MLAPACFAGIIHVDLDSMFINEWHQFYIVYVYYFCLFLLLLFFKLSGEQWGNTRLQLVFCVRIQRPQLINLNQRS